jgi:tRNA pseudouridine32 synthase / 23S rRNA pseudouridine746 synthase
MPSSFVRTLYADPVENASGFLARETGLPRGRVKEAMAKGAAWLKRPGQSERRLRRATAALRAGDEIALYYDPDLLALAPLFPILLADHARFSAWYKPAGLLAQGTRYGDHCSLVRQAELALGGKRPVLPVHRLDREVAGVILLAHDREAAGRLSALLHDERTIKTYLAETLGDPLQSAPNGQIERVLDGKDARTAFDVLTLGPDSRTALVRIRLFSGRTHQIRRHFEMIGHPVLGDPRYGKGNKESGGIRLAALALELTCPFSGKRLHFRIPEEHHLDWMRADGFEPGRH